MISDWKRLHLREQATDCERLARDSKDYATQIFENTRNNLKCIYCKSVLLLAEDLATVSAVVAPFSEGETHSASRTAVHLLVLHPVVCGRTSGLITHRPAEHAATAVAYQDLTVVSEYTRTACYQPSCLETICLISSEQTLAY